MLNPNSEFINIYDSFIVYCTGPDSIYVLCCQHTEVMTMPQIHVNMIPHPVTLN